jgi:hypothetical protein
MNIYVRRATCIVQQAMLLHGGQSRHNYSKAIALVADQVGEAPDGSAGKVGVKPLHQQKSVSWTPRPSSSGWHLNDERRSL